MAELQDVFDLHWENYVDANPTTYHQQKTAEAIIACRTSTLGGHIDTCDECGYTLPSYNSCRNRHCPKCQTVRRDEWVQNRSDDLLDTVYFHVVFTVPACLHELFRSNEEKAYSALFRTSADTLLECGADEKRLGCKIGFTSVLHTSGQNLSYHPHIHAIVCAAGIDKHGGLREAKDNFFVHVKVLSRMFQGKLLESLKALPLTVRGEVDPKRIADILALAWEQDWVVYAKKPFSDAACVLEYLGRYTHKTAISNTRILSVDDESVTFKWRDYRDNNQMKTMTLSAHEFIRRFSMHILPSGFMRIRHYGFLSNNGKRERVEHLRKICGTHPLDCAKLSGLELACKLIGRDITCCPHCGVTLKKRPLPILLC